jgi:hypothetical protein
MAEKSTCDKYDPVAKATSKNCDLRAFVEKSERHNGVSSPLPFYKDEKYSEYEAKNDNANNGTRCPRVCHTF